MSLILDAKSLLADIDGATTLADAERKLEGTGHTLGVLLDEARGKKTIATWLSEGAAGARDSFADPADHLVAGLTGVLKNGKRIVVRAEPRRAVGPDLVPLFVGMGDRLGTIERATLRIHPIGEKRGETSPFLFDRNPPLGADEEMLLARLSDELNAPLKGS